MEVTKEISIFFLMSMGMGTYAFHYLVPTQLTGVGFFKLVLSVSFCSILLGTILDFTIYGISNLLPSVLVLVFLLLMYLKHQDVRSKIMRVLSATTLAIMLVQANWQFKEHFGFFISSLLLTGIVNYIMILGHYYLVVPKLTEKPLIIGMKIIAVFILIKFILSAQNY